MKVRDLMTKTVASCRADTNLAAVGAAMWENDCGVLPVIDESGKVTGIVTDRDICIALSTRGGRSSELTAGEVAISPVLTCEPDDDVHSALKTIREERIYRLPVVNRAGALEGILSMDDIVRQAGKSKGKLKPDVSYDEIAQAFQQICARHGEHRAVVA